MFRRAYVTVPAVLLAAVTAASPLWGEGLSLSISTARLARTFYPGDTIALNVTSQGPVQTVHCLVRDFEGRVVWENSLKMGGGASLVIAPAADLPYGIYYLTFTCDDGQQVEDAFCLIPRPDATLDMDRLFGWHYGGDDEAVWRLLAQVGCRLIRGDISWVDINRREDQWDLVKARRRGELAAKYGIQYIPIIGYTPAYQGIKPLNASGRSAIASHTWAPRSATLWQHYVHITAECLNNYHTQWPAPAVLPDVAADEVVTLPAVRAWEIWNEADQNFYYGPWGRYLDLLRIAYNEIHALQPRTQVIYGGSCGHWTELGMTYHMGGQYYFDLLNLHVGSDFDDALERYYYGAPQIGYGYGLYHESAFTECYLHPYTPTRAQHTPSRCCVITQL